jgi:hypothetical protein
MVALELGNVNVFSLVAGPDTLKNPLPVPPLADPKIPVIVDVPRATVNPAPVAPDVSVPVVMIEELPKNVDHAQSLLALLFFIKNWPVFPPVIGFDAGGNPWEDARIGKRRITRTKFFIAFVIFVFLVK